MPIVEVTHDPLIAPARLRTLAEALPHAVSLAVECPEEPYDGRLLPGDVVDVPGMGLVWQRPPSGGPLGP